MCQIGAISKAMRGPSRGHLKSSWNHLGPSWGPSWGTSWGPSWGHLGRHLGAIPGPWAFEMKISNGKELENSHQMVPEHRYNSKIDLRGNLQIQQQIDLGKTRHENPQPPSCRALAARNTKSTTSNCISLECIEGVWAESVKMTIDSEIFNVYFLGLWETLKYIDLQIFKVT